MWHMFLCCRYERKIRLASRYAYSLVAFAPLLFSSPLLLSSSPSPLSPSRYHHLDTCLNTYLNMSSRPKAIDSPTTRLDLSASQLFYLSVYSIYVHKSPRVVRTLVNQLNPKPKLTLKEIESTYIYLHDTEHEAWVRAKDMNRDEKELLRTILQDCGVKPSRWNVEVIQPVRSMAGLRLKSPTQPQSDLEDHDGETEEVSINPT